MLIDKGESEPLNLIPAHHTSSGIRRWIYRKLPIHVAVHEIHQASSDYIQCDIHQHNQREINVLLTKESSSLEYKYVIADKEVVATAPASIYIPRNTPHSCAHLSGTGYLICIRW